MGEKATTPPKTFSMNVRKPALNAAPNSRRADQLRARIVAGGPLRGLRAPREAVCEFPPLEEGPTARAFLFPYHETLLEPPNSKNKNNAVIT
eukprot:6411629-Pyramimonas_sp.AAC.1